MASAAAIAPPGTTGPVRLNSLDGLRTVAVMLVFFSHIEVGPLGAQRLLPGGFIGVDLFFTLSGFLITALLLKEHAATGSIRLRRFYLKRALRLTPALVVVVLVFSIGGLAVGVSLSPIDPVVALLYVMDIYIPVFRPYVDLFGHTWSLAVEEQFYLVFPPLLVLAIRRRWRLGSLLLAAGGLMAAVGYAGLPYRDFFMYFSPYPHIPFLLTGSFAAVLMVRGGKLSRGTPWGVVAAFILIALVPVALAPNLQHVFLRGGNLVGAALFALVVFFVATNDTSLVSRALSLRPLVWLGRRSYGFYLIHSPLLMLLATPFGVRGASQASIGLLVSIGLTSLSWRYVEQPFLRVKDRISRSHRE